MAIIPRRIDIHVHFDNEITIKYIEISGGMNADEEKEVFDQVEDLVKAAELKNPVAAESAQKKLDDLKSDMKKILAGGLAGRED